MGQHVGYCRACGNRYAVMVYNSVNPETGKLERVCRSCEYKWAQMREPPLPREEYEYAERPWRRLV